MDCATCNRYAINNKAIDEYEIEQRPFLLYIAHMCELKSCFESAKAEESNDVSTIAKSSDMKYYITQCADPGAMPKKVESRHFQHECFFNIMSENSYSFEYKTNGS